MALQRPTRFVMGPCIVEIDHIVIRKVLKGNFGWVWPLWAGRPRFVEIDRIVIREVQYQFAVNRCRNKEICGLCGRGAPGLVMGPCIVEIYRIVIRVVQFQFEVNRCRNEEIIVNGNFGLVLSMWAGRLRIDRVVIREVQYQFEVNRYVNFQGSMASTYRRTEDGDNDNIPTFSPWG
ncbi:hypothetical protein DPMN_145982 [Dreissena polymorpha]|uniref:Uncharacterized protein n=1 Tax=Dreissena polymorpha TaxID=45954 RepID=A0A9D4IZB9_DREPO|nr:hypothetical protein DPMN_145982 [Dreissena polymorpha]